MLLNIFKGNMNGAFPVNFLLSRGHSIRSVLTLASRPATPLVLKTRSRSNLCHKMSALESSLRPPPATTPQFYRRILPSTCISFSSPEGKLVFKQALQNGYMEGYFGLAAQFRTQDELAFCGLSTLVMVLNTLEVDPHRVWKGPWRWYHENMLDCCVPLNIAAKNGVTLDELACLASCNTLNVRMVHVDETFPEESFRKVVKELTKQDDEVLVVSYSRGVLGQTGDGHFSPVAGYHEERDLVLILDTARFKYPPHWVPLPLLHKAMQTHDKDTGIARGFMRLRKSDQVPLVLFKVGESLSVSSVGNQPQDPNRRKTLDSFLKCWNAWLVAPQVDGPDQNILENAANSMIKCLQNLEKEDSILTTQVDISCPQSLSATHGCVIQELLASLESLPLYVVVENAVAQSKQIDCLHTEVGQFEDKSNPCRKRAKLTDSGKREEGNDHMCSKKLLPAHLVTMLICAWPPALSCNAYNCSLLKKLVQAQLCKTSTVLQDEVAQLSRQLHSILDFKQCCSCDNAQC